MNFVANFGNCLACDEVEDEDSGAKREGKVGSTCRGRDCPFLLRGRFLGCGRRTMSKRQHVAVIGGGLVGLATAHQLLHRPGAPAVLLLEKEASPGSHQSTHNSGVLHAGLYYKPGSQKARLAVAGIRQMIAFCRAHDIPHEVCGKLVVATREEEIPRLRTLLERGQANGLQGLQWLETSAMRQREPHVGGLAAVQVPEEGIVDYARVVATLAQRIREAGGELVTGADVSRFQKTAAGWVLGDGRREWAVDYFINCAGLHSDRVCRRAGGEAGLQIVPFRGEYHQLKKERESLVRHLIYPVPDPSFPFLGVHFTRLIGGGVEAGPNAVLAFAREGYSWGRINLRDLAEALAFPGLWRFLWKHKAMCVAEVAQSFSRTRLCRNLQRLVPDLREDDLEPGGAGVRAQAMWPEGRFVEDFHLVHGDRVLHVLNAPSPAATASLAIADHIVASIEAATTVLRPQ